jgi:hypothetical protein
MKNDKMMKKECPDGNIRREFVQRGTRQVRFGLSSAVTGQGKRRVRNESIRHSSKIGYFINYSIRLEKEKTYNASYVQTFIRANDKRQTLSRHNKLLAKNEPCIKFFRKNSCLIQKNSFSLRLYKYNHDITFKKGNVMNNFSYPIDIIDSDDMDIKIINPLNGLIVILDALKTTNLTTDQTQSVFSALSALIFNVKEEATLMSADVDGMKEMISLGGVA